MSALFISAGDRTYGGGDGRSGSKLTTILFQYILGPSQKIALDFDSTARIGLVKAVIDRLQFGQGRDGIRTKGVISWRL